MINDNLLIKSIEASPIDNFQISKYLGNDTKIIKYSELINYNSIEELLPKDLDYVVILIESSYNEGHWVCVARINNTIEFFDPYNVYPDEELKWVVKSLRKELGVDEPLLSDLFDKTIKEVFYNEVKFQSYKNEINTCGRHVINRLIKLKEGMDLNEYQDWMKKIKDRYNISYDEIVSKLISDVNESN